MATTGGGAGGFFKTMGSFNDSSASVLSTGAAVSQCITTGLGTGVKIDGMWLELDIKKVNQQFKEVEQIKI